MSLVRHVFLILIALISLPLAHSQQEQKLPAQITLSASTAEGAARTGATFTVQVAATAPNSGTVSLVPTGSVSFMNGEQSIGAAFLDSHGRASLSVAALPAGDQKITAVYEGDDNFRAVSSAAAAVHAEANGVPSFTLSTSNSTLSVTAGQDVSTVITATPAFGFNQAVSLSCSGVPYANTTCVFSPAQVTPGAATAANPNGIPAISTLSILTTAYGGGELREPGFRRPGIHGNDDTVYAIAAPGILALAGLGLTRRRWLHGKARGAAKLLSIALLLAASGIGLSSCSQRYHYFARPPEGNPGTPAGTYTVVVSGITGNGSSLSTSSVPLTLKVTI